MKKWVILLVLAFVVAAVTGCESAKRSTNMNMQYLRDDSARAFGLDQPSALHPRDTTPTDLYEPYYPIK